MARLRTFLAIDLAKPVRERCVTLQDSLTREAPGVKWVAPHNLHVTLLFLGEVNDRELPAICKAVAAACSPHPAFTMNVEGVGCFPNAQRPRVVWAGVGEGAAETVAIHDALETPLLDLGCYRREERHYTPHVTLGRVKGERDASPLAQALEPFADWSAGRTMVREVRVLSSELANGTPVYTVLSRAALNG